MKYLKLYENNPMAYALAKNLSKLPELDNDKKLAFYTINLVGVCLSQGHVCADLSYYATTRALLEFDIEVEMPQLQEWINWLSQQPYVAVSNDAVADSNQTLLQLNGTKLYLSKYANWEQRLSSQLIERASLRKSFNSILHAENKEGGIDWQSVAIHNSLLSPLSIIVGGPGTGKTTTVANILVKLLEAEGSDDYRIAMAAPTGKAAARMASALNEKLESSKLEENLLEKIPQQAVTLHRLLGWSQSRRHFMYNRTRRLPLNCVIVDEASMIDLSMFVALTEAVPDDCRLILLGDPFQLSSVQAGNVLAEMCSPEALVSFSPKRAESLGLPLPEKTGKSMPVLIDNISYLQKSYRFSDEAGIGLLAKACQQGDDEKLQHALVQNEVTFLNKLSVSDHDHLIEMAFSHYENTSRAATVEEAFEVQSQFQLLCAVKNGDYGIGFYNQTLQQKIPWQQSIHGEPVYHGMPIMMNINHHSLGLFNGDSGLVWEQENQLWLIFKTAEGELQRFLPSQIQGWQSAHAITVHKSQGSEYERVALVLPDCESPLLTREMFYTAVTRAKEHFTCLAKQGELTKAIMNPTTRHSGLREVIELCDIAR